MMIENNKNNNKIYNIKQINGNRNFLHFNQKQQNNLRLSIRAKISNHPKLYGLATSLHKCYYSILGQIHTLPDFLIIGAAKCGTSSLYEYLIQHPNVKPAVQKEIYFFDKNYSKGSKWYRTYFPSSFNKKSSRKSFFITGEATPRYIDHPQAPKRVKKLLPKIKLIILLRNPIDRAFSHWNMQIKNAAIETCSFEDAIDKEKERTKGLCEKMESDKKFYSPEYYRYAYVERGIYLPRIKRWMKYFPKEQFLILKSEDFFENPSETYKQVLQFLNLPNHKLEEYKVFRKGTYNKPEIKLTTTKKLFELYKPHNEELYEFLGKDFGWDN